MAVYAEFNDFIIRPWATKDRQLVADFIRDVLTSYGQKFDASPRGADYDAVNVEECYENTGGLFLIIQKKGDGKFVGTGAFHPFTQKGDSAVEIKKIYLLPEARASGVGIYVLQILEDEIVKRGFTDVWVSYPNSFKDASIIYESSGYRPPANDTANARNDKTFFKQLGTNTT